MIKLDVNLYASSLSIRPEIWNQNLNRFSECEMIFDTGATMTTIDKSVALRAGYSLRTAEVFKVHTAGGEIEVRRIIAPNIKLGGFELGAVAIDVTDFPKEGNTTAVLGLNVIRNFVTTIDIDDKSGLAGYITLNPKFSLEEKDSLESFSLKTSKFGVWIGKTELS